MSVTSLNFAMRQTQLTMIYFEKSYFALSMLFLCAMPLLLLFKKVKGDAPTEMH